VRPFWEAVIREYTQGEFSEAHRPGDVHGWRVFSFKAVTLGGATDTGEVRPRILYSGLWGMRGYSIWP